MVSAGPGLLCGHFIDGQRGRLFLALWAPRQARSGRCVLVVPPFAEELNKCRRMVALTARGLAARGMATVVPDLFGTGDSEGDFEQAEWDLWSTDLHSTASWCRSHGLEPVALLAVRLGAALAAHALSRGDLDPVSRTVLWQPVWDGPRFLTQFLRLRVAAALAELDRKETVQELRARLGAGEVIEVAGYGLSGHLAQALDGAAPPKCMPGQLGRTLWAEVLRGDNATLPPLSANLIHATRAAGGEAIELAVAGEPFWTTTEVTTVPVLVNSTVEFLASDCSC
jgi:exosortase A-associated hydrolase 2